MIDIDFDTVASDGTNTSRHCCRSKELAMLIYETSGVESKCCLFARTSSKAKNSIIAMSITLELQYNPKSYVHQAQSIAATRDGDAINYKTASISESLPTTEIRQSCKTCVYDRAAT